MNIEEASVFAKQVMKIAPPLPDNIFFLEGRFNKSYVPDNFNFRKDFISVYNADYCGDVQLADLTYSKEALDSSKALWIRGGLNEGTLEDSFSLSSEGYLSFTHQPSPYGSSSEIASIKYTLLIPVRNFSSFMQREWYYYAKVKFQNDSSFPAFSYTTSKITNLKRISDTQLEYTSSEYETSYGYTTEWRTLSLYYHYNPYVDFVAFSVEIEESPNNPISVQVFFNDVFVNR